MRPPSSVLYPRVHISIAPSPDYVTEPIFLYTHTTQFAVGSQSVGKAPAGVGAVTDHTVYSYVCALRSTDYITQVSATSGEPWMMTNFHGVVDLSPKPAPNFFAPLSPPISGHETPSYCHSIMSRHLQSHLMEWRRGRDISEFRPSYHDAEKMSNVCPWALVLVSW